MDMYSAYESQYAVPVGVVKCVSVNASCEVV